MRLQPLQVARPARAQSGRHLRQCLNIIVLIIASLYTFNKESIAGPGTIEFNLRARRFTVFLEPATYLEAIATCSSTNQSSGGVLGALLPASLLGDVFSQLAREQPETTQALQSVLVELAAGGPEEQQQWALWTWDEFRVCRAAKLLPAGTGSSSGSTGAGPDLTLVTTDRPCSWRLAYVCAEEQAVVLAAGLSSSSAWYRRHFAAGAPVPLLPSPYSTTGPVAASSDSSSQAGLTLYRSGFVAGGPLGHIYWPDGVNNTYAYGVERAVQPFPLTTEVEDGAERFWRLGPVVTALYRGGNRRLTALRLVREGEAADAWAAYQGQSPAVGLPPPLGDEFVLGDRVPAFDLGPYYVGAPLGLAGPGYETYNVGPYNDYIVAVEGCFTNEVEGLTLVTRSGRRLQLGRGGCSNWFREDAPPGGYLAGAWSQFLNASAWDRYIAEADIRPSGQLVFGQLPWLQQLSFIWAAPAGSPPPTTVVQRPPAMDTWSQPPVCSGAPGLGGRLVGVGVNTCSEALSTADGILVERAHMCSSNTCCDSGAFLTNGIGASNRCAADVKACQRQCAQGASLCGVIPEVTTLHFLAAATLNQSLSDGVQLAAAVAAPVAAATATGPTTAALKSYLVNKLDMLSYADAVQFCTSSSYMGLDWEMVHMQDAFDWVASSWTRRNAHESILAQGYIWMAPSPLLTDSVQPTASTAGASCMRLAFGGLPNRFNTSTKTDDSHTITLVDCNVLAAVVCQAMARPLSATAAAAAVAAAAVAAAAAPVEAAMVVDVPRSSSNSSNSSSFSSLAGVHVSSTYPPAAAVLGGASSLADRGLISPAAAAATWVLGPHTLLSSSGKRVGTGPYSTLNTSQSNWGCSLGIGAAMPPSISTVPNQGTVVTDLQQPVTAISVSIAVQLTNETDNVAVLSAVRLRLGSAGSWQSMGLVSSGGWETFQLAPGEMVVAVSGCAGGFVERLVFHTNAGRRWTHALLGVAAACSVPFLDSAPQPGGYLVGMQGSVGYYVRSLQIVWGMPAGATSGPVLTGNSSLGSDTTADAKQPGQSGSLGSLPAGMTGGPPVQASAAPVLGAADTTTSGSSSSSSSSAPVGAIAGAVVGGVALAMGMGMAVLLLARHRRQKQSHGLEADSKAAEAEGIVFPSLETGSMVNCTGPAAVAITLGAQTGQSGHKQGSAGSVSGRELPPTPYWAGAAAAAASWPVVPDGRVQLPLGSTKALLQWRTMEAGNLMSELSAYIMRMEESITWNLPPRTKGHHHNLTGQGEQAPYSSSRLSSEGNTAEEQQDIGAAISKAQAALAGRQSHAWQGLHILTVLGRGAFGIVYLGTWRNLRVAIKTLVVHDALAGGQARQRHRAIIEAAVSKTLHHPNVVTTYEAEVVPLAVVPEVASSVLGNQTTPMQDDPLASMGGGDVYKLLIIQEYCNVGSLAAAFEAGIFKSCTGRGPGLLCGLTLALDIVCGMRHIHHRNIIHGDLSTGNVLLCSLAGSEWLEPGAVVKATGNSTPSGGVIHGNGTPALVTGDAITGSAPAADEGDMQLLRPLAGLWRPPVRAKVSDFGLSLPMHTNQTHASNHFQGTPGYAAPEVLSHGRLSLAADVWSFGVLLLELCHGLRYKHIIAQQQATVGDMDPSTAAASASTPAAHLGLGKSVGTSNSSSEGAPAWAVLPPSCPPQLTALVQSCLSLSPSARPTFDQVASQLAAVLVESHSSVTQQIELPAVEVKEHHPTQMCWATA